MSTGSTSSELAKTRTYGKARCHNANCSARIAIPHGVSTVKCENCGCEWRVIWVNKQVCRIRGPVWEVNRRIAEETLAKEKAQQQSQKK